MPAGSAVDILRAAGVSSEGADTVLGTVLLLAADRIVEAVSALRDAGYDQLVDLFGTDTGDAVELTYHLRVLAERKDLYLKCHVPYEGGLESVWEVYPAALYPEREAAELLGFSLAGHPNPKRLLTTDGTPPLLRKSVRIRTTEEVRHS
jgi:NADH:ubiquinone oxidoreductase subunit C